MNTVDLLMDTLKPHSNTVIDALAVDSGMLHLVQRGGDW